MTETTDEVQLYRLPGRPIITPCTDHGTETICGRCKITFELEPLDAIREALSAVEVADRTLHAAVDAARAEGHSWEVIGKVLGVTRQAAWERFTRGQR